jgi:hypothetical protein
LQDWGALRVDQRWIEERLALDQQDLTEFETVAGSRGPNSAAGAADTTPARRVEQPEGLGRDPVNHTPMVIRTCDPDDRHTGWPDLLAQRSPEVGEG